MTRPDNAVRDLELVHDLLDCATASHPWRRALEFDGTAVDYKSLQQRSCRLAAWLSGLGVRRADRVVVALPPDVNLPAVLYACSRIGAVFVVVADAAPEVAFEHVLDDAEPVLLLADSPAARQLADQRGISCQGLADLSRAAETHRYESEPQRPLAVDAVCLIYTSGSTGMPKAVVSTHAQVTFAARAIQSQLQYRPDDVVYSPLPMSFDYALYQVFLCALSGAQLCVGSAADTGSRLLTRLNDVGATILPAVPSLATNLAALLTRQGALPPPLRLLTNTGAAMPATVLKALRVRVPRLRVQLMFGLTECKRAAIMPVDGDLSRPGSCGKALPGTEIFAVDDNGDRRAPGEIGELVIRGPHVMAGYWRRPDLTAKRFQRVEGLFPQLHTGDYGWLDPLGYVYFVGRRDDLYKQRGIRVSATEVEAAAYRLPGIRAAGVVPPTADEEGATLVVESDLAAHEILRNLGTQLEGGKVPARCLVVAGLPLSDNGKVDRAALARLVVERAHV